MGDLWIIEQFVGCQPKLQVWPLLHVTASSYIVKLRDGERAFRRKAAGRTYCRSEEEAVRVLRAIYCREYDNADRAVRRYRRLVMANDANLIAYARGVEEVMDQIEKEARG